MYRWLAVIHDDDHHTRLRSALAQALVRARAANTPERRIFETIFVSSSMKHPAGTGWDQAEDGAPMWRRRGEIW